MQVDFYFGPGSRYSYLASTQLDAIAARTGARFRWRPVLSSELARAAGYAPFEGAPTSGQYDMAYRDKDIARWAALYGAPYAGDPNFPQAHWRAMTLACVACGERAEAMGRAIYRAQFAEGAPPTTDRALHALAAEIGVPDLQARLAAPGLEAAYAEILAQARAAGAFGAPSFVAGGELFFGNDRLVLLERFLMQSAR
jgi:2-hydroxychromene-2-carboxylate isomerase